VISLTDNATTIEIKGAAYAVESIPAGEFGTAAARVTKLVNGDSYDVILKHDGRCECDCPDFEARHRGLPTQGCKHIRGVKAAGLLVAVPAPVAPKPVVAPITRKDLARAAMFKIKLPAAPMAVEEPAKVEGPVVELPAANPFAEVLDFIATLPIPVKVEAPAPVDEPADDFGPEGDSWEAWPESLDRYEPEAEPIEPAPSDIDLTGFASSVVIVGDVVEVTPPAELAPFDDPRLGETVALRITRSAVEDGDDGAYFRLDPGDVEAFWGFVGSIGWPVATWRGWLALCRSGSVVSLPGPVEASRPTWNPRVEPTPAERAEAAALLNAGTRDYTVRRPVRIARPTASHPPVDPRDIHHAELCEAGAYFAPRYAI
jgi:hypothetical protein